MSIAEELDALSAIYTAENEFVVHQRGSNGTGDSGIAICTFTWNPQASCTSVSFTFQIPTEYPHAAPVVSVSSSSWTRDLCSSIALKLQGFAKKHLGDNMLMELIMWINDQCSRMQNEGSDCRKTPDNVKETGSVSTGDSEDSITTLLRLDHMRNKTKYIKFISKWTDELGLGGRLIFFHKFIFIIIQGSHRANKEYIHRQRNVSVDVDSRGKSCKERMLSVLAEVPSPSIRFSTFEINEDIQMKEDLHLLLTSNQLDTLWKYIDDII